MSINKNLITINLLKITTGIILISVILAFCNKKSESDRYDGPLAVPAVTKRSINDYITNSDCNSASTQAFDKSIEKFLRKSNIKGASFALMKNGKLIYAKGYGMADVENSVPLENYHLLRVASMSKLFTAVGVLKLVEEGKISLQSPVFGQAGIINDSIFLDIHDERLKEIKVIDLLRHQGGFSRPIGDPCFHVDLVAARIKKELPLSLDDMVYYAVKNKLRAAPGKRYKYSNLGYVILSKVIEKAGGMDYETYMQKHVFAPALCFDMHLTENYREHRNKNEVCYYEVKEAEKYPAADGSGRLVYRSNGANDIKLLSGAGAWCGSAAEILRFTSSIDNSLNINPILSDESIRLMTENEIPIGWAKTNGASWQRSGSMAGTNSFLKRQPDGLTWVFITNTSSWRGYKFSRNIDREITSYIKRVDDWPDSDLFELAEK